MKEVPRTHRLDIPIAKRQQDNKNKKKRTSFFRRTGLWVSGSTGKQAVELLKTQIKKKSMSDKMVKTDTHLRKKNLPINPVYCYNLWKESFFFFASFIFVLSLFMYFGLAVVNTCSVSAFQPSLFFN